MFFYRNKNQSNDAAVIATRDKRTSLLTCLRGAAAVEYLTTVGGALVISYGLYYFSGKAKQKITAQGDAITNVESTLPGANSTNTGGVVDTSSLVQQGVSSGNNVTAEKLGAVAMQFGSPNVRFNATPGTSTAKMTEVGMTKGFKSPVTIDSSSAGTTIRGQVPVAPGVNVGGGITFNENGFQGGSVTGTLDLPGTGGLVTGGSTLGWSREDGATLGATGTIGPVSRDFGTVNLGDVVDAINHPVNPNDARVVAERAEEKYRDALERTSRSGR